MPRHLADYDALAVPPDPALRGVFARADADPQFLADLERVMFEAAPMPAEEVDCHAANFFVMAMDGVGNAFGVYVDPEVARTHGTPWVMWQHEDDSLILLADDTASFFTGLLDFHAAYDPNDPSVGRVRAALGELGLTLGAPGTSDPDWLAGKPAAWLPVLRSH